MTVLLEVIGATLAGCYLLALVHAAYESSTWFGVGLSLVIVIPVVRVLATTCH